MAHIKQVQVGGVTYDIHAFQADAASNSAKLEGKTLQQVVDQAKSEGSFAHFVLAKDAATTPKGVVWTKSGTSITGTLEATSADKNVLYLVPSTNRSAISDVHDEYIVVGAGTTASPYAWERVGHTDIKLKTVSANTGGPSNNNTSNAGGATVTTSEFDHGSATGSVSLVYKKSADATGSKGSTATANTNQTGSHSHTFTGTAATISISASGSAEESGSHNHTVTPSTTSVIGTVSGTTASINAAPSATGEAGGHTHSISPSTATIYSAPAETGSTGAHTHTVTVDSHSHGADVTVLNGVSASTTSIYQITGVGTKASGSDVTCATATVTNGVLVISAATATKISSYGSVATRAAVTVATGVSSTTAAVAAPGAAATLTAACSSTGAHTHSIGRTSKTVVTGITVTGSAGAHTHGITGVAKTVVTAVSSTPATVLTAVSLTEAGAHTHAVSASGSTTYTPAGTLNSTGAHSHTYVSLPAHTHSIALTDTTITDDFSIAIGKHTHSVTIANHSHTLNSHTHSYNYVENDQA